MQICSSKVEIIHYGSEIPPIFLPCYAAYSTCTDIALKLQQLIVNIGKQ